MDDRRTTTLLGIGMVALGCVQAVYAATRGDAILAGLGLVYAALGGVLAWRERAPN